MNKYSNFELEGTKTRNEQVLEESLKEIKNYKTDAVNFNNFEDVYFRDSNYHELNTKEVPLMKNINTLSDPRYTQNNTRNESKKQMNNAKNLKLIKNQVDGAELNSNMGSFKETNYESLNIENESDDKPVIKPNIRDLELKLKEIQKDSKKFIKMSSKKLNVETTKFKILQYKNCSEDIQEMIANALITIWKKDFALKKITSYVGVRNFILHNFKDKMAAFFVLFNEENDFIATFAIDTENFAPFVSHLFVNPNIRNAGFGKKALRYAEKYIKKLGFDVSNLWCEEKLVGYYKKNGYVVDSQMKIAEDMNVWKMCKNLS